MLKGRSRKLGIGWYGIVIRNVLGVSFELFDRSRKGPYTCIILQDLLDIQAILARGCVVCRPDRCLRRRVKVRYEYLRSEKKSQEHQDAIVDRSVRMAKSKGPAKSCRH